jgi:hypothetical protein
LSDRRFPVNPHDAERARFAVLTTCDRSFAGRRVRHGRGAVDGLLTSEKLAAIAGFDIELRGDCQPWFIVVEITQSHELGIVVAAMAVVASDRSCTSSWASCDRARSGPERETVIAPQEIPPHQKLARQIHGVAWRTDTSSAPSFDRRPSGRLQRVLTYLCRRIRCPLRTVPHPAVGFR